MGPPELLQQIEDLKPADRKGDAMCWPCWSNLADRHEIDTSDIIFLAAPTEDGMSSVLRLVTPEPEQSPLIDNFVIEVSA